jgi:hypothetical protein
MSFHEVSVSTFVTVLQTLNLVADLTMNIAVHRHKQVMLVKDAYDEQNIVFV